MSRSDTRVLREVALFASLGEDALDQIARAASVRDIPADAILFREGESALRFFVVLRGTIKLTQLTPEGHQVVLRLLRTGDATGGAAAFGDGVYPVTAEAVTDAALYEWAGGAMLQLMEQHPRLAINAARFVAARLHELQVQYRQLATEKVEQRIARALVHLARQSGTQIHDGVLIDLPLSRDDIAQMTGTTLYTVSRVVSRWEADGLLDAGRQRIVIRALNRLLTIADELP